MHFKYQFFSKYGEENFLKLDGIHHAKNFYPFYFKASIIPLIEDL